MSTLHRRCDDLISHQVVERLKVRLGKLKWPMIISQLDGLITGKMPVTCFTEPIKIKVGTHLEII